MGSLKMPNKVKVIAGMLSADTAFFPKVKNALEKMLGRVDFESAIIDFDHTDYYREEMGCGLKRVFFAFDRLRKIEDVYKIKRRTNALEKRLSCNGKRKVNIDPGYVDLSKVVLLSTKDYSHRIYTGNGIYAEVTLFFKDNTFNPWPWTYPDYRTPAYIGVFNSIRHIYKENNLSGK